MAKQFKNLPDGRDTMEGADGARLLDTVCEILAIRSDAALGRLCHISCPQLSKIRNNHIPVTAAVLLRLHDVTGIPIADLRGYARGD